MNPCLSKKNTRKITLWELFIKIYPDFNNCVGEEHNIGLGCGDWIEDLIASSLSSIFRVILRRSFDCAVDKAKLVISF